MDAYEKMIMLMRREGAKDNPEGLKLGEMLPSYGCRIAGLDFEADELLFSEDLIGNLSAGDSVLCCRIGDSYIIIAKVVGI